MSRYVCGSHELKSNASIVPPKNWEARSWSGEGDGHQEHSTAGCSSIELALARSSCASSWSPSFPKPVPARLS
ncbi:unnamed protein product [Microthlaspi erraticum]|uniref:Uncharacterized protein n=1 Tax=Microthlaspi erraticum TaxID=1685480 RepID=A0A6D2JS31_9BRAS|nr:unnamed protein product [Microthlaspi erraticum]